MSLPLCADSTSYAVNFCLVSALGGGRLLVSALGGCCLVSEGGQEGAEEGGQLGAVALGERVEQLALGLEQGGEGGVDGGLALAR